MKGLKEINGEKIDFVGLTKQERILDDGTFYRERGDDWQFAIDDAISRHQRIYLQLARGHDKTDRFAWWSLLWLCSSSAAKGYCAGVDRDNAALFRDSSRKLKALHPELFSSIEVQKNIVLNHETGSYIETISSDADSAYGLNFDLLIINDFHAWPDKTFWEVLWTACFKKPGIRVWMESNALTYGEEDVQWKYEFRKWVQVDGTKFHDETKEDNNGWYFFAPPRFLAKWQSEGIEQWRRTLHPAQFQRLINNIDTTGECAFVTEEQVKACCLLKGTSKGWPTDLEAKEFKKGYVVTGVDLGLKKDATAIATVQSLPVQRGNPPKFHLLALDVLTGDPGDPVLLREVEQIILLHKFKYKSYPILCDPWNAASLIQKYGFMVEWPFTVKHVSELTQLLYRAISDKQLAIYPGAGTAYQGSYGNKEEWTLERELTQAVVKEMSYGQRIDHQSGGYSDRIMSIGMCLHFLSTEANIPKLKSLQVEGGKKDEWSGGKMIDDWNSLIAPGKGLSF
jgi:hypothetical protein